MPDGHCLCGSVSWTFQGTPLWTGFCHCGSCRRNCAAPVTAFIGVADGSWKWTGQAPASYASSDHAARLFCSRCGTPMAYRSTRYPDEVHFYAASLADPANFNTTQHYHRNEQLPWLHLTDDSNVQDSARNKIMATKAEKRG